MKIQKLNLAMASLALLLGITACSSDANKTTEKALPTIQNAENVHAVWQGSTGDGVGKSSLNFAPALSDNTVYTASQNGMLIAQDSKTGKVIWSQKLKNAITSALTVGDGTVFVNTDSGELLALNGHTGAQIFKITLPNKSFASAAYSNGIVIDKTVDETLLAVNASTGATFWTFKASAPSMILEGGSSPTIDENIVIEGSADGQLTLLTLDQGQMLWQRKVVEPNGISDISRMVDIDSDPVSRGNIIYVASYQGNLSAIDKFKAEPLWTHRLSTRTNLALNDQTIFLSDTKGRVWAFDANTGRVLWKQNQLLGRILTAPVLINDNLVLADNTGMVHWLSQDDGHFTARVFLDKSGINSDPSTDGEKVFVMANNGKLAAYQF